jgi:hypothetical protein
MLKLTVAVLAVALAGAANAAGWRSLRLDASSEEAFVQSVEAFEKKLSPARDWVFRQALRDIWTQGTKSATAEQREYTEAEYRRQVDGLSYEEVVTLTDPTGKTAKDRYRTASLSARRGFAAPVPSSGAQPPPVQNGVYRGWTTQGGIRVDNNR